MGFEQLAALKAQLTKEAKLKKQQEQASQPAAKQAEKPAERPAHKQGEKPANQPGGKHAQRPAAKPDRPARPARPSGNARSGEKAPPVDPVVRVIGKLQKRFPAAFPKNPAPKLPLKVGILADLTAHASELQLSEAEIREAVSTWCRGSRYWACLTDGAARVDLAGEPAGVVTSRDAAFARNQAKGGPGGRRKPRGKGGVANAEAGGQQPQAEATQAEATQAEATQAEATQAEAPRSDAVQSLNAEAPNEEAKREEPASAESNGVEASSDSREA